MVRGLAGFLAGLLKLALVLFSVSCLLAGGLFYGLYRLLGGGRKLKRPRRSSAASDGVWLRLKLPGANRRRCPHCRARLDPERDEAVCPHCYRDLQRPCPHCGEPVPVQRRLCPACRAPLQRPAG